MRTFRALVLAVALSGAAVGGNGVVRAEGHASPVMPATSRVGGKTYGEWSASWWQWAHGTPVHTGDAVTHPVVDTGDVDCSIGQTGPVWFLAGTFGFPSAYTATRRCEIPT